MVDCMLHNTEEIHYKHIGRIEKIHCQRTHEIIRWKIVDDCGTMLPQKDFVQSDGEFSELKVLN